MSYTRQSAQISALKNANAALVEQLAHANKQIRMLKRKARIGTTPTSFVIDTLAHAGESTDHSSSDDQMVLDADIVSMAELEANVGSWSADTVSAVGQVSSTPLPTFEPPTYDPNGYSFNQTTYNPIGYTPIDTEDISEWRRSWEPPMTWDGYNL